MSAVLGKILDSISGRRHSIPKENPDDADHRGRQLLHPAGLSVPVLNQSRIRVVIFRDEKGVKQPVFDSQQLPTDEGGEEQCSRSLCDMRYGEKLESSLSSSSGATSTTTSSRSAGWASQSGKTVRRRGFLIKRPSTDSELLGEMMFGSMPMKVIGNTVKVHYIRSTDQLMLSKVFTSDPKPLGQCSLNDFTDSCPVSGGYSISSSSGRGSHRSFSADPRGLMASQRRISPDGLRPQSTSTLGVPISSHSPHPHPQPHPSPSPLSSSPRSPSSPLNSYNPLSLSSSLTRRIQRSRTTSLENPSELYRKVLKPLDQHSSSSSGGRRKRKYAIGFIVCLSELNKPDIRHFQSFVFSHFTLIDAHLERLKLGVEEAFDGRRNLQAASDHITRAYESFLEDFISLYKAPRIESPVWLSLVSCVGQRKQVCLQFMEELNTAITDMDTKETKYFLSSLLTAVLSHHLAWVFTVARQHAIDGSGRHGKHPSKSLGVLAESHPYNPLWAQLGDLLGAVGYPLKISRTVVSGHSVAAVSRLLYLLTYFIRCSEVEPGFTPELYPGSPLAATHTMKIPGSSHTSTDDLVHQLDEADMFGSRASSVTVMSDPERASLFSPFASPVNQGMDMPIIRTYPFGIRTTPLSTTGTTPGIDFLRKGSQSETDSMDSLHLQHNQLHHHGGMGTDSSSMGTGAAPPKKHSSLNKSGEISMSQSSQSSTSKKLSPLLVSSGSTTRLDLNGFSPGLCDLPSDSPAPHTSSSTADFARGVNNTCCSSVAAARNQNMCATSSKCPLGKDGFIMFDPTATAKPLLSPDHTRYSLPSHTSSSSLDSGYDQSLSLTDSCRDSCTEFINGPSSLRSGTCSNATYKTSSSSIRVDSMSGLSSSAAGAMSYSELNLDSGLGDKRPVFMLKTHPLHDDYGSRDGASLEEGKCLMGADGCCMGESGPLGLTVPGDCSTEREDLSLSPNISASSSSVALYQARNSEELSVNTVHSNNASILSGDTCVASDPECSLRGSRGKMLSLSKGSSPMWSDRSPSARESVETEAVDEDVRSPDLPSPLSPDPTNSQLDLDSDVSAPVESFSLSKDPTKALPPRKLKNHFKDFHGDNKLATDDIDESKQTTDRHLSPVCISYGSQVLNDEQGTERQSGSSQLSSDAAAAKLLLWSTSLHSSLPPQTPHHSSTSSQAQCTGFGCSTEVSAASLSTSPVVSPSETKPPQPSSFTGVESPYGSEADSGRGTKISLHVVDASDSHATEEPHDLQLSSLHQQFWKNLELSSATDDVTSSLQPRSLLEAGYAHSNVRASSSPPLFGGHFRPEDEEEMCSLGGGTQRSFPLTSYSSASDLSTVRHSRDNDSNRGKEDWTNPFQSLPSTITGKSNIPASNEELVESSSEQDITKSLPSQSLKKYPPHHHHDRSLLEQQLNDHERSLLMRDRPNTLERFGNFEDIPLPDLEEFHLDTPSEYVARGHEEAESHRQQMSDFGHSLFVGISPKYLPDFVVHGTTQTVDQEMQEKLVRDLAHSIKYPVIEEPVDVGVGILASTDSWSVKLHAVTKSLQTNDVLVGAANSQPSRVVRQMLASIKNMHAMNMPPDFCLSYMEDCLMSLNEQSVLLANALLEKGGLDLELSDILPAIMEELSLSQSDLVLLLPLAAINSVEPDLSARLNHLHMQRLIGKHFI